MTEEELRDLVEDLESRLSALQQSHGRLLGACKGLVALDHDSDDCAGVNEDCEVCEAMKAARAAIAEATPPTKEEKHNENEDKLNENSDLEIDTPDLESAHQPNIVRGVLQRDNQQSSTART